MAVVVTWHVCMVEHQHSRCKLALLMACHNKNNYIAS